MKGNHKQKCVIIGEAGVGKSTLLSLLQGRKDLKKRNPTIGVAIEEVFIDNDKFAVWDLAGQDRFKFMWEDFTRGAGLTVVVTDSTQENLELTKEICDRHNRFKGSKIIAIANKQDKPGAIHAQNIANQLGIKTYGMCAVNPANKGTIQSILKHELDSIE